MVGDSGADQEWLGGQTEIERAAAFYGQLPLCMLPSADDCFGCCLETSSPCPVRVDADYRSYLIHLRDVHFAHERRKAEQINLLTAVLRRYKEPLHWENLAILAIRESPLLFTSAHSIKALMFLHPEVFRMVSDGVFVAN